MWGSVTRLAKGTVTKLDTTHTNARQLGKVLIVLPDTWQQFLPR